MGILFRRPPNYPRAETKLMKNSLLALGLLAAMGMGLSAQQQNSFMATMAFNGNVGSSFPINPVNLPRGYSVQVQIQSGLQWMPFLVGFSPTLLANGAPWGPNIVDLNPVGLSIPFNGLTNPLFSTGATGTWLANFTVAATTPLGAASCWQTAIANAGSPVGATLTAASRLVVTAGITAQALTLGDDQSISFSVASFGMTLPFYAQNYNNLYVHSNGELCFGTPNSDFTPTTSEFTSQMPRICGDWTDLDPGLTSPGFPASITAVVDQATPPGFLRVDFVNVSEWGLGAMHTFSMKVWAAPLGDVEVSHGVNSTMGFYDIICGITAGGNLGPQNGANPMKDLSAMNANPIVGAANENFHEWYGTLNGSMPYYQPTPLIARPMDLQGTTQTYFALGAGAAGAYYIGTSF